MVLKFASTGVPVTPDFQVEKLVYVRVVPVAPPTVTKSPTKTARKALRNPRYIRN
jgi:hypothetical protein